MPGSQNSERFLMALYYAYGRADSSHGLTEAAKVDPIPFAEHYMDLFADFTNGEASYMPSVQAAWDVYRRSLVS